MARERCRNCGCEIGDLETPYVWNENTVCRSCYAKLQPSNVPSKGVLLAVTSVAVVTTAILGEIWLAKSVHKSGSQQTILAMQQPQAGIQSTEPAAQNPPPYVFDNDIFDVVRNHGDAGPEKLQEILSTAISGRKAVFNWDWAVDERSGYRDGIELHIRNPHSSAAGIEQSLRIISTDAEIKDKSCAGTALIRGKTYSIYGLDVQMKSTQTEQAAATPLGTQGLRFAGDISFLCFETDGTVFIEILMKDTEFN
jgi:hypothetical protein